MALVSNFPLVNFNQLVNISLNKNTLYSTIGL